MKISEVLLLTDANLVCGHEKLSKDVARGFSSDLMSDVLTLDSENLLLITGLSNIQTIRTAEMADLSKTQKPQNEETGRPYNGYCSKFCASFLYLD